MKSLSPLFEVPANSSRFFDNHLDSVLQPIGKVQLVWDCENGIIVNKEYAPELIKYDSQYCTTVSAVGKQYTIPTLGYINEVLGHLKISPIVIDIGCGQGELVFTLREKGIDAWGFDPVMRTPNQFVESRLWKSTDRPADLYVMRCVLPHIENPWEFLLQISISSPEALVLIEFQRVEWVLEHNLWYQISHDHVNLFSIQDFSKRYKLKSSGEFSNGEWGWVLLSPSETLGTKNVLSNNFAVDFQTLFNQKASFLKKASSFGFPIVIWGAAGKGIVLAYSLSLLREKLLAVDADTNRWGRYLEASGVLVESPKRILENVVKGTLILVCNPNHLEEVKSHVQGRFDVKLPNQLIDC